MRRCLGHLSVSLSAKVSVSLTPSLLVSVGLPSACLCGMASETEITAQSTYYSTADFPLSDVDVLESSLSLSFSLSSSSSFWPHILAKSRPSVVHFRSHRRWAAAAFAAAGL